MPAELGRTARVYWGDDSPIPLIAGVTQKTLTINGEPVDISSDDDAGWMNFIDDEVDVQGIEISVTGVLKDDTLKTAIANGERTKPAEFVYSDGSKWSGTFFLAAYSETGEYNSAITFEATFRSQGAVSYTPAS